MRFLKKKVNLTPDYLEEKCEPEFDTKVTTQLSPISTDYNETSSAADSSSPSTQIKILSSRAPRQRPPCPQGNSKNLVKNYGKALCNFASSDIAVPYIKNIIERNFYTDVKIPVFAKYIDGKRSQITNIESLRSLLIVNEEDDDLRRAYKRVFQEISIIFLKYFCVNWIFHSKIIQKNAHMKFRFKMLRRVQDPEHFTYLKTLFKQK